MFKSLAAILAATVITAPAIARTDNNMDAHRRLWSAVQSVGVETFINDATLCEGGHDGAYMWIKESRRSALVICQDNAELGGPEVEWTANDLDTLRHEAWHLVQDCLAGVRADDESQLAVDDDIYRHQMTAAAIDILGVSVVNNIIEGYRANGLDNEGILHEIEAFMTARAVPADFIALSVTQTCAAR